MRDCPRAAKWFGGCKFEARYDEKPPQGNIHSHPLFMKDAIGVIEAMTERVYVADVCIRCGEKVMRNGEK